MPPSMPSNASIVFASASDCEGPTALRAESRSVSTNQCSISCVNIDRFADLFSRVVLSAEM